MPVTGPTFIALQVRDVERTAEFYETRLRLKRTPVALPGAVVLDTKPASFALRAARRAGPGRWPSRPRARGGDLEALVRLLDPDVELRADAAATPQGASLELRGAHVVARAALASTGRVRYSCPALVGGAVGIVMAPRGQLVLVLGFTFDGDTITAIDVIADPGRLRALDLAVVRLSVR